MSAAENAALAREMFDSISNCWSFEHLQDLWVDVEYLKSQRKIDAKVYDILMKASAHREQIIRHAQAQKASGKKAPKPKAAPKKKAPKKAPKKPKKAPAKKKAAPAKAKAPKLTKAQFKARMAAGKAKAAKARAKTGKK